VPEPAAGLPDPALVVLIGAAGSGKSSWAAARYRPAEIVSADQLRGIVGSGEHDLAASADAFRLLDQIAAARLGRGLTTVVDTLGLDPARRRAQRDLARQAGLPAVAVLLETSPAECRARNRARDRPVPATVLDGQLRRMAEIPAEVAAEGWDVVLAGPALGTAQPGLAAVNPPAAAAAAPAPPDQLPPHRGTPARSARSRAGSASCCRSPGSRGATTRRRGWPR
jgi:predicted kinase